MKFLMIGCITLLTACATTNQNNALTKELTSIQSTGLLACEFIKNNTHGNQNKQANWYFWRENNRTESRDTLFNQGEIWQRSCKEQLFYTRLFFNEKATVEFTAGDLAATNKTAAWQQLTSIVNPQLLGKELPLITKETVNGNRVEYYSGIINGVTTEVDWLPSLQLPARFLKKEADNSVTITLNSCSNNPNTLAVKPVTKKELDNLRRIDYTDLGDMENEPLVQQLEQLMLEQHH